MYHLLGSSTRTARNPRPAMHTHATFLTTIDASLLTHATASLYHTPYPSPPTLALAHAAATLRSLLAPPAPGTRARNVGAAVVWHEPAGPPTLALAGYDQYTRDALSRILAVGFAPHANRSLDSLAAKRLSLGPHLQQTFPVQDHPHAGSITFLLHTTHPDHVTPFFAIAARLAAQAIVHTAIRPELRRRALVKQLSKAQRAVLPHLLSDCSEREIAHRLSRSRHTVHDHTKAIYQAWGVCSRVQLIHKWNHHPPADPEPARNIRIDLNPASQTSGSQPPIVQTTSAHPPGAQHPGTLHVEVSRQPRPLLGN